MLKKKLLPDRKDDTSKSKARPMEITIKAVVLNDKQEVLLLKRKKDDLNGGKWDLPGGLLEERETVAEALKRELQEETNLKVEVGPVIRVSEFPKDDKNFLTEKRGLRYIAYVVSGQVTVSQEHEDHRWLPIKEAIEVFSEKDGFEKEKRQTLMAAKRHLDMEYALEGWKRVLADFENYKKRTQKSNEEFRKYCMEDTFLELLPILDNFEMAAAHIPDDQKSGGWAVGIMHIKNQLQSFLEQRGVTEIAVKPGDQIDATIHEVISAEAVKEGDKAKVKTVVKKGYKMGDKVIRAAVVTAE